MTTWRGCSLANPNAISQAWIAIFVGLVLRDQIALNLELGKLPSGTRLPSERKLQSDSGAARGTVREALFQLEAEGLIYRRDRSGRYVSPPAVTNDPTRWYGFMTYVAE
jgi:DNA-binding GntR family transcriptional regulator